MHLISAEMFFFNGIIYVIGGYLQFPDLNNTEGGVFSNKIQKFNIASGNSTTLNQTLPVGLANFAIASFNSRIYIFGGSNTSAVASSNVYSICLEKPPTTTTTPTTPAPSIDQTATLAGLLTFSLVVIALFCIAIVIFYVKSRRQQRKQLEEHYK